MQDRKRHLLFSWVGRIDIVVDGCVEATIVEGCPQAGVLISSDEIRGGVPEVGRMIKCWRYQLPDGAFEQEIEMLPIKPYVKTKNRAG